MDYLDFELQIGSGAGREYPVAVIRSPGGEALETMRFPFDELALENRLQALEIALLRSGGTRRRIATPEEQTVLEFGRSLFGALFTGEVRSRYDVSLQEAVRQGKGLRLRLRIQPPELASLPWEFLYDERRAEYVVLSRETPLVRYIELPRPLQPLAVDPPLRILGMIAGPKDQSPLDTERERQRVEQAVGSLHASGRTALTWLAGQGWQHLQQAMRGGPWHVFHFIGHGGFDATSDEGLIALAGEAGLTQQLTATQLARLLANHRPLRLVVLNSCEGARGGKRDVFSSTGAILTRRGIPAVVAMQYEVTDRAAIEFARAFYESIADGFPVDAAVSEARTAISIAMTNTLEWGTPVLYTRAPDGVLFNLTKVDPLVSRPPPPSPPTPSPRMSLVEVVMLGHTGHGKTTLLSAITRVLSWRHLAEYTPVDAIENAARDAKQKTALAISSVTFSTEARSYRAADFPTATDTRAGLQGTADQPRIGVLVVSAEDGPMPETRNHIQLARQANLPDLVVFMNKSEMVGDRELLDLTELEIRELLTTYGFSGDAAPVLRGSALNALRSVSEGLDTSSVIELLRVLDHVSEQLIARQHPRGR